MSITRLIYTWLEIFTILIDFLPTKSESIKTNRDKQTRRNNQRQTAKWFKRLSFEWRKQKERVKERKIDAQQCNALQNTHSSTEWREREKKTDKQRNRMGREETTKKSEASWSINKYHIKIFNFLSFRFYFIFGFWWMWRWKLVFNHTPYNQQPF